MEGIKNVLKKLIRNYWKEHTREDSQFHTTTDLSSPYGGFQPTHFKPSEASKTNKQPRLLTNE